MNNKVAAVLKTIANHLVTIRQTKTGYYFALCHGCHWESVAYATQTTAKRVGDWHLDDEIHNATA